MINPLIKHHDPAHSDDVLDQMQERAQAYMKTVVKKDIPVIFAKEGMTIEV